MQSSRRGIWVAVVGWSGVIAVAVLMALSGDIAPALVFSAIAIAVVFWLWRSGGRAALWISLAFGGLFALQHAGYSVAALGGDVLTLAGDALGLAAGVTIVVGSAMALVQSRRACAYC